MAHVSKIKEVMRFTFLTRTIWIVSLVSLFTDISSEMLYPVMPIYLKSIGFSAFLIGILEGFVEATAGLSKGYFGKLSDLTGKRLPFVQLGYFLSSLSKPMLAMFTYPLWVFLARFTDRLGKGVRTGARDALLSDESSKENRGKVFGFHRSLDTLGAAIGPLVALFYLCFYPEQYQSLFLIAFIPALLGIFLTLIIKEKPSSVIVKKDTAYNIFSYFSYWKEASPNYRKLLIGLLVFTFFNSSDVFIFLMAKNQGINDQYIISAYIFYNLIYAITSYPLGSLADKIGMKKTFVMGLTFFVLVYTGMAYVNDIKELFFLFFLYGIYSASTEGVSKAWISKITTNSDTATAIGLYASLSSIFTLLASSFFGLFWIELNPSAPFIISASGAFFAIIYFLSVKIEG